MCSGLGRSCGTKPTGARAKLRKRSLLGLGRGCGTKPIGAREKLRNEANWSLGEVAERSQFGEAGLWGWEVISVFFDGFWRLGLAGLGGTGLFLLCGRRTSHHGSLTNVASRMNPTLMPPRGIGRRTWFRNELLPGERAALFQFQTSRRGGRVLGMGRASD